MDKGVRSRRSARRPDATDAQTAPRTEGAPWPVVFELVCGLEPERALRVTCDLPALRLECAWLREGRPLGPPQVIPPGAFSQVDVEQWIDLLLVADPWLEGRPPTA